MPIEDLDKLEKEQLRRIAKMPADFKDFLESVDGKRAHAVIDRILDKGYCTTEYLQSIGYEHPPRAARDVRERGVNLKTRKYRSENGRVLGLYVLGDFKQETAGNKSKGRTAIDREIKTALLTAYGNRCFIWQEELPACDLQVDHRISFEIAGEPEDSANPAHWMLLCASANRQKSWACEHCENWKAKKPEQCARCFWAYPENYTHIAGRRGIVVPINLDSEDAAKAYRAAVDKHGKAEVLERLSYAAVDMLDKLE